MPILSMFALMADTEGTLKSVIRIKTLETINIDSKFHRNLVISLCDRLSWITLLVKGELKMAVVHKRSKSLGIMQSAMNTHTKFCQTSGLIDIVLLRRC